jgi:hypothetical protein
VIFHCSDDLSVERVLKSFSNAVSSENDRLAGLHNSSDRFEELLKLTVSARETRVIANVAFSSGSSQHGKALRAAMGYDPPKKLVKA